LPLGNELSKLPSPLENFTISFDQPSELPMSWIGINPASIDIFEKKIATCPFSDYIHLNDRSPHPAASRGLNWRTKPSRARHPCPTSSPSSCERKSDSVEYHTLKRATTEARSRAGSASSLEKSRICHRRRDRFDFQNGCRIQTRVFWNDLNTAAIAAG